MTTLGSAGAARDLGRALEGLGRWDEAVEAHRQAGEWGEADAWLDLAIAGLRLERWTEARDAARRAMTLGKVAVNWGDAGDSRLKTAVVRDLLDRPDVARIDVTAPMAPVTSTHREPSTWTPAESASRGPSGSPSGPDATAGTETSP